MKKKFPLPMIIDCEGLSKKLIAELADRLSLHFQEVKVEGEEITLTDRLVLVTTVSRGKSLTVSALKSLNKVDLSRRPPSGGCCEPCRVRLNPSPFFIIDCGSKRLPDSAGDDSRNCQKLWQVPPEVFCSLKILPLIFNSALRRRRVDLKVKQKKELHYE